MKTVKEIFSKAFGEVPEGAWIHTAIDWENFENKNFRYGVKLNLSTEFDLMEGLCYWETGEASWIEYDMLLATSPDISDRPAESFRGFFGAEFDNALDAEGEK